MVVPGFARAITTRNVRGQYTISQGRGQAMRCLAAGPPKGRASREADTPSALRDIAGTMS